MYPSIKWKNYTDKINDGTGARENSDRNFYIDVKAIDNSRNTTEKDFLKEFGIRILDSAKNNGKLDDLIKFYHEVLVSEEWGGEEDGYSDNVLHADISNDVAKDVETIDKRLGIDECMKMHRELNDATVGGQLGDISANSNCKRHFYVRRETKEDNILYERVVLEDDMKCLNTQKDDIKYDGPTESSEKVERFLADDSNICKLPFAAIAKGRPDILKICFQSGVDMNKFLDSRDRNLLIYAVSLPSLDVSILDLLLDGINIQARTKWHERTALTECLLNSQIDSSTKLSTVKRLLSAGITVESAGVLKSTPLHVYLNGIISNQYGFIDDSWKEIIDALVKAGNEVNIVDFNGKTPLMDVIEMTVPDGMDTPEEVRIRERNFSIAEYLLQKGTDPDSRDFDGKSSIFCAALSQNLTILKMVLKYCKNVSMQDHMGMTAMYRLCCFIEGPYDEGDINTIILPMIDALEKAGCDLNKQAIDLSTALHQASVKQPHEICELLCTLGAKTNTDDYLKRTALHLAARNADTEVIKVLLRHGADIDARDINFETPLHHACIFGNAEAVNILVREGADVEAQNALGIRPIHLAAEQGDLGIIKYLVSVADQSARDKYGAHVLHYAAADGNTDTVKYLLQIGIDDTRCEKTGMTALDFARYMGHLECSKILQGSQSARFGNLPPDCFPNGPLLERTQVEEYYQNLSEKFKHEAANQRLQPTEIARGLLTSKGLGSVSLNRDEGKLILDLMLTYAHALAKKIGEIDPLFQCTILRAGSTLEGVKIGYPDEFDFLCDLTLFRQYVSHFERSDTIGFAKVLLKEDVPENVKRLCSGDTRCLNSAQILRHFSKLALQAKFDVLSKTDFRGHIYSGATLLEETSPIFTGQYIHLAKLHSQSVSFRGAHHKHLFVDVDFNPVIFSSRFPAEANAECHNIPDVASRGIYVIPKLCNFGLRPEGYVPSVDELWRYSTQHIEAEMMQAMPKMALDSYMVCKIFRMEPLACSVKYLEFAAANLSEKQLRQLLPHGSALYKEDECGSICSASTADDPPEQEMQEGWRTTGAEPVVQTLPEGAMTETDTEIDSEVQTSTNSAETRSESGMVHIFEKMSNIGSDTFSDDDIHGEYEMEITDDNIVEVTAEKIIPSYYVKSIFIKEMERMARDGQTLAEDSLVKVPRRVYEQLQDAFREGQLTTLFMPDHNMLKNDSDWKVLEMREKYCTNILRLMDTMGFI